MRKIAPLLVAILLIGGGCAPQSTPNTTANKNASVNSEASLQIALEKAYTDMYATLVAKDFKGFTASFSRKDDRLTEKLFLDSQELLNKVFKPLDKSKFISAYQKGDKAFMIRQTYLDDPNYISIDGQIYNYKDGKWFIGEFSTGDSVSKDKEKPENDKTAVQEAIEGIKKDLENFKPEDHK